MFYIGILAEKDNSTDVKNIICFFSFHFIIQNVRMSKEWVSERECVCVCVLCTEVRIYVDMSSAFFFFVLYFRETGRGPPQGIESSQFLHAFQFWAVWHNTRAHANPCGHISSLPPTVAHGFVSFSHPTHVIYAALPQGTLAACLLLGNRSNSCLFFVQAWLHSTMPTTQFTQHIKRIFKSITNKIIVYKNS